MHERYIEEKIVRIWSDEHKLALWQETELAVIKAEGDLGFIARDIYDRIAKIFSDHPIDIKWWKEKDKEISHDLLAFIEERLRHLPLDLKPFLHRKITSYDTEEAAFARMLRESLELVYEHYSKLKGIVEKLAVKYRYVIMNGRTHGQEAELQSVGKRLLSWLADLKLNLKNLLAAADNLKYSKISGANGNYGSIDPRVEAKALAILGFEPYYGATQIMPREIYASVANALSQFTMTINKMAKAIRLGARSGRPIWQEPFGTKQRGSSTMPHKKNTIKTEQEEGMARLALGYSLCATMNILTWEERSIEQSSVERVIWPDLFHTVIRSFKNIEQVLGDLPVFADNMLCEVINSRGCYASSEAKEVLKELGVEYGLSATDAYLAVQLAAFDVFEPSGEESKVRNNQPRSLEEADRQLAEFAQLPARPIVSIRELIPRGQLRSLASHGASEETVAGWNALLKKIFQNPENLDRWNRTFMPSYLLRNEEILFEKLLDTHPLSDLGSGGFVKVS